ATPRTSTSSPAPASRCKPRSERRGSATNRGAAGRPPLSHVAAGEIHGCGYSRVPCYPGGQGDDGVLRNRTARMILNLTYGTGVISAPAEFKTAVAAVQQLFESTFTDPVTVNIQVDFGHLGHGLLGQSSYGLNTYSFSQITAAVMANSKSGDDANAIASLPTTDPIPGTHHYVMTPAEAKALGLLGATTTPAGTATFSSAAAFDYDRSDGITAGQYDFQGSVAHEFSEIMGRELNAIGNEVQTGEANGYYLYDLFKFTGSGEHSFVGTTPGYFSPDNGATNLNDFNHDPDDDFGDWAKGAGDDSFLAFSDSGVV